VLKKSAHSQWRAVVSYGIVQVSRRGPQIIK